MYPLAHDPRDHDGTIAVITMAGIRTSAVPAGTAPAGLRQRAHRNPMALSWVEAWSVREVSAVSPASRRPFMNCITGLPSSHEPPRYCVDRWLSMVHSATFPAMSNAPALETQPEREPVLTGAPAETMPPPVLQALA